jgi:hypothetical protein
MSQIELNVELVALDLGMDVVSLLFCMLSACQAISNLPCHTQPGTALRSIELLG